MEEVIFYNQIKELLPFYAKDLSPEKLQPIISPYTLKLPLHFLDQARSFVKAFYQLKNSSSYQLLLSENYTSDQKQFLDTNKQQESLLMAYDFHIDIESQQMKLIEINTNASGYLISDLINKTNNLKTSALEHLKTSFIQEMSFCKTNTPFIAIIDETLEQQKMLLEFHLYQKLLQDWGYDSVIIDEKDLSFKNNEVYAKDKKIDFIYNRFCDFTLERDSSENLKNSYLAEKVVLSPNPKEYLLNADKKCLNMLSLEKAWERLKDPNKDIIQNLLLKSFPIQSFEKEELWKNRKKFFFKPQTSYGGKGAYRGSSISKKVFERIFEQDFLVQEFFPAPIVSKDICTNVHEGLKFDLRFFVYADQIQHFTARTYHGQVTNFSDPQGGFASIEFI